MGSEVAPPGGGALPSARPSVLSQEHSGLASRGAWGFSINRKCHIIFLFQREVPKEVKSNRVTVFNPSDCNPTSVLFSHTRLLAPGNVPALVLGY